MRTEPSGTNFPNSLGHLHKPGSRPIPPEIVVRLHPFLGDDG